MRTLILVSFSLSAGCMVGHEDAHTSVGADLAAQRGLDYAWSRPSSPQALKAAGYSFVARYLSYDTSGKNLTAGEARDLFGAGIDVVANWEWGAMDALDGYQTGHDQAVRALQEANDCGMPADRPIYFSVDFDVAASQQPAIDSYFDGVASVLGVDRTGAYGGYYLIQRLFDHGKIKWGWQTYAWSGGQWDPRAQLRQIQNDVTVAGAASDIDESVASDFGQWGPNAPAAATPPEGSQAFLYPNQQHFFAVAGADLAHSYWDGAQQMVVHDTWGTGVAGKPVTIVAGAAQHVFARGTGGSLEHYFWDPSAGLAHTTWAASGVASDPAAIVIGDYQDAWAVDGGGSLQHWWWGPNTNGVAHDTWGAGVAGRPTAMLYGPDQHVFARGTGGTLEHFWWTAETGMHHDVWGNGIADDPAVLRINEFQDVWAVDGGGNLQHWWWGPQTNGFQHDTWGGGVAGRPSVILAGTQQHAFVRGTGGTLEHFWWDPSGGLQHDVWGTGIASDPTAMLIGSQQHVWATDATGKLLHWYWEPATDTITHDTW